ncbi:hypothetical protein SAMN04489844_0538 [Nocardioides exalbidus]|uniref:Capsular polysaccharide biosynthesis protein n=1 Tax=Nocardioides exalbidus TaxID=402596 RepID=A0A1H4KDH4_9ACTN|nr:hypothetical protein [Nocardioides exalbidus]SEB56443.1 hypothetical protein SAMN04489844_0538 [Nocardioides exalbidus]
MTTRDLISAALRRWYVMLVGALVTLGFVYVSTHQPTVYWTQFNVLLIGPKIDQFPNYLENSRYTLFPLVGVVANDLNDGDPVMVTASTDTNMVGQGISDGIQVRVPNLGTQWRRTMTANYLDVQVAGATPDEVTERAKEAVESVAKALVERQDEIGISPALRVTSVAATDDPTVFAMDGSRMRATAATGASGAAVTISLVYWLERRRAKRRARA